MDLVGGGGGVGFVVGAGVVEFLEVDDGVGV